MKKETRPAKTAFELNLLSNNLNIEKFRRILSHSIWNMLVETIDYTRSHELGIDKGLELLMYAEENQKCFGVEERQEHLEKLYLFILHELDKLDRWEEYLDAWDKIQTNTGFSITYSKRTKYEDANPQRGQFEDMRPYILFEDRTNLYVHFLYSISHRKKIVERKLGRKKAGKKVGNQFHAQQDDLSDEEINRRFDSMIKKAQWVKEFNLLLKRVERNQKTTWADQKRLLAQVLSRGPGFRPRSS